MSEANFADRLIGAIRQKGNPCIVGLDPRIEAMPEFALEAAGRVSGDEAIRTAIAEFHRCVIEVVAPRVPAVKLQIAFYEQYGIPGLLAFADTVALAKAAGLVVVVDAKRNDIASTAQAYADAFLGRAEAFGAEAPGFDVDCITVSPFLGRDSLEPFVSTCSRHGKGIFVLVKTSNPGSGDLQDVADGGATISERLARMVDELGLDLVGRSGYSSIGAVVGATFPSQAEGLRALLPRGIVLVPGYGAQGGTAEDAIAAFNPDGLGAVVNASRSITYSFADGEGNEQGFAEAVERNVSAMIEEINAALRERTGLPA